MKTIKLKLDIKNNIILDKKYNVNKFLFKEDITEMLSKKLKKPITELKKKTTLINSIFENKFELFLEKKIINHIKTSINNKIKTGKINYVNDFMETLGVHSNIQRKYNPKTNEFNIKLSYKKQLADAIHLFEFRYGSNRKEEAFYKQYNLFEYPIEYLQQSEKRFNAFMNNKVVTGTQKYWLSENGRNEIEFIENSLEQLGKIKIEVFNSANKQIETFFVKYKIS